MGLSIESFTSNLKEAFADKPFFTSLLAIAVTYSCYSSFSGASKLLRMFGVGGKKPCYKPCHVGAHEKLSNHSHEFSKKEILKVTDGVWVAIGFGLANSILIEGDEGVIVVDCMESSVCGEDIMANFQEHCSKPVVALIYTHNHTDHIGGARAYLNYSKDGQCAIYANDRTAAIIRNFYVKTGPISFMRGARQFGQFLSKDQHINSGIGPCLRGVNQDTPIDLVMPTHTFDKELILTVAGVTLHLLHAPGETDDQIVVYLPDKRLLCPADNIYKAFPNLYAIRGTPARDAYVWATSLEMMRLLKAKYLVPSHTRPLEGDELIDSTISSYRDAVLFVHDQTIRLMNRGYFLNDIVANVTLPPHLKDHPYLQEFYGTVEWSVRGIFTTYLGWFSGDPAELHALSSVEEADRMVKLAGGYEKLLNIVEEALIEKDYQWALVCAQHIVRCNESLRSDAAAVKARASMVRALHGLAEKEVSANGRNYYLTYALELIDGSSPLQPSATIRNGVIKMLNGVEVLKMLPIRLDGKKAENVDMRTLYTFPDIRKSAIIEIRRGVSVVNEVEYVPPEAPMPDEVSLAITVSSSDFVDIACKLKNKTTAVLNGEMQVRGKGITSSIALKKFMDLFDESDCVVVPPL